MYMKKVQMEIFGKNGISYSLSSAHPPSDDAPNPRIAPLRPLRDASRCDEGAQQPQVAEKKEFVRQGVAESVEQLEDAIQVALAFVRSKSLSSMF